MADIRTEFRHIDNILLEDAGTNGAGDYMAQMSWTLFLKYLDDLEETREPTRGIWMVKVEDINPTTLDLGVKNPHEPETEELKTPEKTLREIRTIDKEVAKILSEIKP